MPATYAMPTPLGRQRRGPKPPPLNVLCLQTAPRAEWSQVQMRSPEDNYTARRGVSSRSVGDTDKLNHRIVRDTLIFRGASMVKDERVSPSSENSVIVLRDR